MRVDELRGGVWAIQQKIDGGQIGNESHFWKDLIVFKCRPLLYQYITAHLLEIERLHVRERSVAGEV